MNRNREQISRPPAETKRAAAGRGHRPRSLPRGTPAVGADPAHSGGDDTIQDEIDNLYAIAPALRPAERFRFEGFVATHFALTTGRSSIQQSHYARRYRFISLISQVSERSSYLPSPKISDTRAYTCRHVSTRFKRAIHSSMYDRSSSSPTKRMIPAMSRTCLVCSLLNLSGHQAATANDAAGLSCAQFRLTQA